MGGEEERGGGRGTVRKRFGSVLFGCGVEWVALRSTPLLCPLLRRWAHLGSPPTRRNH